jgi:hypothetical protein
MAFKLILSAKANGRKLDGSSCLAEAIEGVPFKYGIKQNKRAACDHRHQLSVIARKPTVQVD